MATDAKAQLDIRNAQLGGMAKDGLRILNRLKIAARHDAPCRIFEVPL